ncbi:MAG: UDP-N-acetylmuramoylalanine--D-glutamate ligase [Parcubacteria group bacterium ADurb.Bin326]|nr:MAG: UDP-N-acetylmuramoylalanine--D-glutamate ligase [Parcubacteria group bacterium ADurb.Bin326]
MNLKGKKVTVMGLGLYEEGSGISATKFLVEAGAKVTVTDLKTEVQLADQLKRLGKMKDKIKLVLGKHRVSDFKGVDLVVRNPGVPASSKFLKLARANKIPIVNDISLFFQLIDRKRVLAVTGTRGKSTTTTLLYEFIRRIDKNAVLGGNITKSPLAQMPLVSRGGNVVLELSSWLLEGLEDIKRSPHLAVFTNIYPDHLNTYKGIKEYAEAKKNIFKYQTPQDYVILNRDNPYTLKMGKEVVAQRFWYSLNPFKEENGCFVRSGNIYFRHNGVEQKICSTKTLRLPGEHNLSNALASICGAMIYGLRPAQVIAVLKDFKGVPNRLELLKEVGGVKYYNDTTSTTPEATIAALRALGGKKNIVLIAGGSDKGLDFKVLSKEIGKQCRLAILLTGTGTERLKPLLLKQKELDLAEVSSMKEAVALAKDQATKGGIVLLSPACASFGMFINEFDRGNQFIKIIKSLR